MTLIFPATIRSGKLVLDKAEQFQAHLRSFPNEKRVEVTVEKITHKRTNQQNKYYWSVVVKEIAQHTGHDPEQVHELLKQLWSPKWHFALNVPVPTSTTRLDVIAFVEYTEKCRLWANEFLGLNIPLPNEVSI